MKPLLLLAASALALSAAACAPNAPQRRAALECPAEQGSLTRTAAAADGKSCAYTTSEGAEVTLRLVPVEGSADATLAALETSLVAERAEAAADVVEGPSGADETSPGAAREAAEVERQAAADPREARVTVRVEAGKGGTVVERGGTTRVELPGIHIVADEHSDTANVRIGPLRVNAGADGATVRMRRDVRLKGEAFSREKRGVRATFISEGRDLPGGYHFLAYEAAGPKAGPLTVAVVKARGDIDEGGHIYRDVKKLVRRNGGV